MNLHEIEIYFTKIVHANSELAKKELLKTLLVRLFDADSTAKGIIDKIEINDNNYISTFR